jgi:gamma-glutamyltranspeptidase/glutathione hydrolase
MSGGNAVDAAVATAAVLGVVQPMMSGVGGDTFLLYYDARKAQTWALNGSGVVPYAATREFFLERGYTKMPLRGMTGSRSISVVGRGAEPRGRGLGASSAHTCGGSGTRS